MKQLTLLFITFCSLPALLSFSGGRPKKSLFNGVWQFTQGSINGEQTQQANIIEMKVFNNGRFDGYRMLIRGSVKTMSGRYKMLNDSTYTETLITAPNRMMVGQTYVIKYHLQGNVMIATGSYDVPNNGLASKVHYRQTWTKVDTQDWDRQYHKNH
jgi:hypothetical protein